MAAKDFLPPACSLIFERYSFKRDPSKCQKRIMRKHFNHSVSVIIPDHAQVPRSISSVLENEPYWIVKNLPVSELIQREFIEAFVKKGKVCMLSHGRNIDEENCFSLTPNGEINLNVTKDTIEELGLEGHVSKFRSKRPSKYVVKIKITESYFQPGKKGYDRVKWCLTDRLGLTADFIFSWQPHDDSICPSSLSSYFSKKGYDCPMYSIQHKLTQCPAKSRPLVETTSIEEADSHCSYEEFWEWLGGVALGVEDGAPDDYINTIACCSASTPMNTCVNSTYTGLIPTQRVVEVVNECRAFVKEADLPWIAVTVHGFADSPESWEGWEHGYHGNGDSLYAFVLFHNDDFWHYMASGPQDTLS